MTTHEALILVEAFRNSNERYYNAGAMAEARKVLWEAALEIVQMREALRG